MRGFFVGTTKLRRSLRGDYENPQAYKDDDRPEKKCAILSVLPEHVDSDETEDSAEDDGEEPKSGEELNHFEVLLRSRRRLDQKASFEKRLKHVHEVMAFLAEAFFKALLNLL